MPLLKQWFRKSSKCTVNALFDISHMKEANTLKPSSKSAPPYMIEVMGSCLLIMWWVDFKGLTRGPITSQHIEQQESLYFLESLKSLRGSCHGEEWVCETIKVTCIWEVGANEAHMQKDNCSLHKQGDQSWLLLTGFYQLHQVFLHIQLIGFLKETPPKKPT